MSRSYFMESFSVQKFGSRVEVNVVSDVGSTMRITAQQTAQILAQMATVDHDAVVVALLIALRNERRGTEQSVGALWVALVNTYDNWRRERLSYETTPAATTSQARR